MWNIIIRIDIFLLPELIITCKIPQIHRRSCIFKCSFLFCLFLFMYKFHSYFSFMLLDMLFSSLNLSWRNSGCRMRNELGGKAKKRRKQRPWKNVALSFPVRDKLFDLPEFSSRNVWHFPQWFDIPVGVISSPYVWWIIICCMQLKSLSFKLI